MLRASAQLDLGVHVTCLTRDAKRFRAECPDLAGHGAVSLLQGDVRFFDFPHAEFTHLIHAMTDTSASADQRPLKLLETIVDGTRRVLAFAHMAGIRKVLFTSSGAVYGAQPSDVERIPKSHPGACPTDAPYATYGQSKRLAEHLCTLYHHAQGVETKIARCFAFASTAAVVRGH